MATTVPQALRQGKLHTDKLLYAFLKLPISHTESALNVLASCSSHQPPQAFQGFLYDKDEITLMVAESTFQANKEVLLKTVKDGLDVASSPYRIITFDVVMDPNLIGFMESVTKVLAAESISVLPFAAYSRDHIFIQEKDFDKAIGALEKLRDSVSEDKKQE
eukprot:Nitzschia sp. Nitz4//scaffold246_size28974//19014//19499//NITZ4_008085-RA/size28974-processed-gene-0.12-mRNA-1//1//CDS//3329543921//3797//frame0